MQQTFLIIKIQFLKLFIISIGITVGLIPLGNIIDVLKIFKVRLTIFKKYFPEI